MHRKSDVMAYTFIPALGRQKHVDLCEFEASQSQKQASSTLRDAIWKPSPKQRHITNPARCCGLGA